MAFRVVRLRKEARRNAKLEEIFMVRNSWKKEEEKKNYLFRRKTRTKAEQSTWIILLRYSACMR